MFPLTNLQVQNPWIDKLYLVQERRTTHFKSPKMWKGSSGNVNHKQILFKRPANMLAILRYIGWVKDYNQIFELRAGSTGSREKSGLGWHYEPEKKTV